MCHMVHAAVTAAAKVCATGVWTSESGSDTPIRYDLNSKNYSVPKLLYNIHYSFGDQLSLLDIEFSKLKILLGVSVSRARY